VDIDHYLAFVESGRAPRFKWWSARWQMSRKVLMILAPWRSIVLTCGKRRFQP